MAGIWRESKLIWHSSKFAKVQFVDITGVWGISFWLVLFNVLVVMAVENTNGRMGEWANGRMEEYNSHSPTLPLSHSPVLGLIRRLAVVAAAMLIVPLTYSAYVFIRAERASGPDLSVLMVQPNVNP